MRAYEMRPVGVTARVFDSADSMKHHSWTEELRGKGGRAHRRSRIPRFRVLSNTSERAIGPAGPVAAAGSPVRCPRGLEPDPADPWPPIRTLRPTRRARTLP